MKQKSKKRTNIKQKHVQRGLPIKIGGDGGWPLQTNPFYQIKFYMKSQIANVWLKKILSVFSRLL